MGLVLIQAQGAADIDEIAAVRAADGLDFEPVLGAEHPGDRVGDHELEDTTYS